MKHLLNQFLCKKVSYYFLFLVILILSNSCVTNRKTTYLQEYSKSGYQNDTSPSAEYLIQPNDNLYIRVTTPDPRWSAMFNTLPVSATTFGQSAQSIDLISYTVKLDGTVYIPYIGSILVVGKTVAETRAILGVAFSEYVTDASITVKIVNNYISILGEVNRPGRYPILEERLNVFQAIALAGDLATYGDRYSINLIRQQIDGTSITKTFDLTDKSIIDSEYYFIHPNDVIYVQPLPGKFLGFNEFPWALIISTVSATVLLLNYIEN